MIKKILFLIIIVIVMFIIIHESYHIALILLYGYPANLFLLFLIFIYLYLRKNKKLEKFFPQIKNNFISIIYSISIISIIAPFIILYAKNFSYNSVLLFELSLINIRDKILSVTNLNFSYLFIIFFTLLFLSFLLNKNLSIFYEKTQNAINYLILVLFSITSFSLTSSYFIDKKAKEIYNDTYNNITIIEQKINNKKKFILTCNILKDTFRNQLFKKDILNKIVTHKSIKNPKENAINFSYYLAYYFNKNHPPKAKIKEKNTKFDNIITYKKIKKILSNYEKKTSELLIINKQQNIIKNNTINLLTDILTKTININQDNILKVFINTLINDFNNRISIIAIEYFDYKTNIFSFIEEKKYFKYLKKYNKNTIKLHNDFEFKFKVPNIPKIKFKNRLRWFKYIRL